MQRFMAMHLCDIAAIQQPIDLLPSDCENVFIMLGPVEFFLRQGLVIEHKTIALPEQTLDLIALPIDENIELAIKRIMVKLQFNNST